MKLYIKNKVVTIGGSSFVRNEAGEDVYKVKGRIISPTRYKTICDMDGNVLYKVRNKWFTLFFPKAYILDASGVKIAKVTHNGILGFKVVDYPDNILVEGGIKFERTIVKNGETVGSTRRRIDLFRDSFELSVNDNEDIPFFVALVIAIDNMRDKAADQAN